MCTRFGYATLDLKQFGERPQQSSLIEPVDKSEEESKEKEKESEEENKYKLPFPIDIKEVKTQEEADKVSLAI